MPGSVSLLGWTWQPVAEPLSIAAVAAVLTALGVFAYGRSYRARPVVSVMLLVMRLAFVGAVVVLMMGPSRILPQSQVARRPKLTILLDTSQSMMTDDCRSVSRCRYVQERLLSRNLRNHLRRDFDVQLFGFDEDVRSIPSGALTRPDHELATGRFTLLADSLTALLGRMPDENDGDVLLLISDGHDTEQTPVDSAAALAESKGVPIYSVAVGGETMQADLALLAIPMQEYLLPGEPGGILVKVYQNGLETAATTITLDDGETTQSFPISFDHKNVVEVQLPVERDQEGQYEYKVTARPVDSETEVANNSQIVFCEVQKRRIRVLLLEGQPFWDSKFLAQSLRKDERIELTQITQLSSEKRETLVTRAEGEGPRVPRRAEEWAAFDVVILGKSLENVLDERGASQLVDFVSDQGGHLIFARGPASNPHTTGAAGVNSALAPLEPVVWADGQLESLRVSLTPAGRASPWLTSTRMGTDVDQALARLPGLQTMNVVERVKAATIVLARASPAGGGGPGPSDFPALARMNFGRGSVAAVLGEGLWQWSLLSPENQDLAGFYDTFWSNLVRWLAMGGDFKPGQQVALELSRSTARLGDDLTADVVYKHTPPEGAHPHLELTEPDGSTRQVALSPVTSRVPRFRATLDPESTGLHRLSLLAPGMIPERQEKRFNVYDVNLEQLHTQANPTVLRTLAEHTGGQFFEADQIDDVVDRLERHRASMLSPPRLEYVWDHGTVMVILLTWAGAEWLLRRLAGFL